MIREKRTSLLAGAVIVAVGFGGLSVAPAQAASKTSKQGDEATTQVRRTNAVTPGGRRTNSTNVSPSATRFKAIKVQRRTNTGSGI